MDVVVDGLMVINSRKDPTAGSEELQVFSWGFYGLGGIVGCTASGILLGPITSPQSCFFVMALFAAGVAVSGLYIDPKLEDNSADLIEMSLWNRTKFVFKEVGTGLKLKELYTAVIFSALLGALVPNFTAYLYYY